MKIEKVEAYPIIIPVKKLKEGGIAPYRGSKDNEGTSSVSSMVFKLTTEEGICGWGEMNMIYSLGITEAIIKDFLEPLLIGKDALERNKIMESLRSLYNPDINTLHLASGVEMALWDIAGKELGCPVYSLLGGKVRDKVEIAYAFGYLDEEETRIKIEQIRAEGYKTIKTKGGISLEEDIDRAFCMRETAGDDIEIRVDMNQAYTTDEAIRYMKAVEPCRLQYVEQPMRVRKLSDYHVLRCRTCTPVAVNEDTYIPGSMMEIIRQSAADAAVVDMESCGGISELQKTAFLAEQAGMPLAHHCAWDLGIKTAAVIHAASAMEAFTMAMDTTYMAHEKDILKQPLVIKDGCYHIPEGAGLGICVDEELIKEYGCRDSTIRFVF